MKKTASEKRVNDFWLCPTNPALEAALYYGFDVDRQFSIGKKEKDAAKGLKNHDLDHHHLDPEEKLAVLLQYVDNDNLPLPINVAYNSTSEDTDKDSKYTRMSFDIIGSTRSIADAAIIKLLYELAKDQYEEPIVEINSFGDKDSSVRFIRELGNYFRKNLSELDAECRQNFKKGPLAIVECTHEKCKEIKELAPHSINYLTEPSRLHFKECLEFLEMSDVPYTINNNLIESNEFVTHTIFRILAKEHGKKEPIVVAWGGRWGTLSKKAGFKKDFPGVSGELLIKKVSKQDQKKLKKVKKPHFYFVQVGQEAKLKSLQVIETLRRSKIPLYHALTKDKLTAQLASAEQLKSPHMLIMGQKESMEHSVLVRNTHDRSQDAVQIHQIADHIKKLFK